MKNEELNILLEQIRVNLRELDLITIELSQWKLDSALRRYRDILARSMRHFDRISSNQVELNELGIEIHLSSIIQVLQEIATAWDNKDWIMIGDLFTLRLTPLFQDEFTQLRAISEVEIQDCLDKNLTLLSDNQPELAELLTQYINSQKYTEDYLKYRIEQTESGYYTLKCIMKDTSFYLHSNRNPYLEIYKWFSSVIRDDVSEYHLLGVGLGYSYQILRNMVGEGFTIHFYETELFVLTESLRYIPFTKNTFCRTFIHYDPSLQKLFQYIGKHDIQTLLYSPSIRNIHNEAVREAITKFYIADTSINETKLRLRGNFLANQASDFHSIDELANTFKDRSVIIIAAGPSLDKNITQLQNRKTNSIIIATGTVFRKLITMNIVPDYIVISEANERVSNQLVVAVEKRTEEVKTIPLIILSSTTPTVTRGYEGPVYMAYQYEFDLAEATAQSKNCRLFMTGGSVSTTAFDIAIRLGAKRVIFLGLDLAYTDNLAHADGTSQRQALRDKEWVLIPASDGTEVYSDAKFILYRDWFQRRIKMEDIEEIEVINATEGGALIQGMQSKKLSEIVDL